MCFEFAETRLWRAVLIRAVQDAMSKKLDAEHKADARNWICKKISTSRSFVLLQMSIRTHCVLRFCKKK